MVFFFDKYREGLFKLECFQYMLCTISYVFFTLYTICNHVIYYVITISLCIIFIFHLLHFVTILFLYRRYFSSMGDGTLVIYLIFVWENNLLEKFRSKKT